MPIAKGVYVENVDIGRHYKHVLRKRSEHVPRIEIEEGSNKVETECGRQSDENDTRGLGGEE